jgi:hypothetical protein
MSRERNDFPVLPIPTSIGAGNGNPFGEAHRAESSMFRTSHS